MFEQIGSYGFAVGIGLSIKVIWDRWLSKKSRVDIPTCELYRKDVINTMQNIVTDVKHQMEYQKNCLDKGEIDFEKIDLFLTALGFGFLKICRKIEVDGCEEIECILAKRGILK